MSDSEDMMTALLGKSVKGRKNIVLEANGKTSFRTGDWVLIPPYKGEPLSWNSNVETALSLEYQLYNLKKDVGQTTNLARSNPKKLQELLTDFEAIRGKEYSKAN